MAMPPEDAQTAQDQFRRTQLERGGAEIETLTAALNDRIQKLESWLAELPGRVETKVTIPDPDDPENYKFSLRLKRSTWALHYQYLERTTTPQGILWPTTNDWRAVRSAGLDAKMATVEAFPALLARMQEAQENLVARLREANTKFDRHADAVGLTHEEGA